MSGHYEPYQVEMASQPAAPHPDDVAYMWDAHSRVIGDANRSVGANAPTIGRDPRQERTSTLSTPNSSPNSSPRSAPPSGPLSRPAQSGPSTGPIGGATERKRPSGCVLAAGGCLVVMAAIIALCAMSLGVVTALAAVSRPATSTTTRSLHVNGAPTLDVTSSAASVRVTGDPTDSNTVTVTMTASVKTTSYDSAHSIVQGIKLAANQVGNIITIGLTDNNGFTLQAFLVRNVTLDITTPTHTSVSGALQAGSLVADDLTGALNVTANAGAVTLRRMTFTGASTLRLSAGGLAFDGSLSQGATVDASVNAGGVVCTLPSQRGTHLNASATSGSITIVGWNTPINRSVASASVNADVGAHPTGALTVRVNAGSVVVTLT